MRALLLAAGLGTRLRPLTDTVPKCLVDIDGRPLLDHWLELLSRAGITEVLVNLHHLREAVEAFLTTVRHPLRVTLVDEPVLLGTGGTVLANRDWLRNEPALVAHADNLSLFDVDAFRQRFESRREGIEITMMTFRTDRPQACGIVELDAQGTVQGFHEKVANPPGNLANAAVYILSPRVSGFLEELNRTVIDLSTEVLPRFVGRINTFENEVYHRDIGTIESLEIARREYPAAAARHALGEGSGRGSGGASTRR
jgi:mannose-1-phosphate guanylyltransferase